jgi:hypothetical protein
LKTKALIKRSISSRLPTKVQKYRYLNSLKNNSQKRLKLMSLLRFEVNIVDRCNLNCMGCEHFSPVAEKNISTLTIIKKTVSELQN